MVHFNGGTHVREAAWTGDASLQSAGLDYFKTEIDEFANLRSVVYHIEPPSMRLTESALPGADSGSGLTGRRVLEDN